MFKKVSFQWLASFICGTLLATVLLSSGCDRTSSLPTAEAIDDASLVLAAPSGSSFTRTLERCADVLAGPAKPAQHMLIRHGVVAGGDPLTSGSMDLDLSSGVVEINLTGSHPLNLYEVYWIAARAKNLNTDGILMGNFVTDINGDAVAEQVRNISTVSDISGASPINHKAIKVSHGYRANAIGWFLIYSRGPYASDDNGDGTIDSSEYNTSSGETLANPPVADLTDGVQYVSTN